MKKTLLLVLVSISIALLIVRFSSKGLEIFLGIKEKSGLSILSQPSDATVFLDGQEVGKTPYEDKNLLVKDYVVKIEKDQSFWEGKVSLIAGTLVVVNRELSKELTTSAGEILTLRKGRGLTVISNPNSADVEVDNKPSGKTPLSVNVSSGEHNVSVSHPGYLKRNIRAMLPSEYNLVVSVDLAIAEADLTTITTPPITQTPQVLVKDTPTGFLRVRDKPSLSGKEIAQVKPGDTLILLEELPSWDRVRLPDGTEGYVSSVYVEKKNP